MKFAACSLAAVVLALAVGASSPRTAMSRPAAATTARVMLRTEIARAVARSDTAYLQRLFAHARVRTTGGTIRHAPRAGVARVRSGCHPEVWVSSVVSDLGIHIARQTLYLRGWCWNGRRITRSYREKTVRSAFPTLCWTATYDADVWTVPPKWRRSEARGQLGVGIHGGCLALKNVADWIDYANGGGWWRHHSS